MPDQPDAPKAPLRAVPLERVREAKGQKVVAVPRGKVASTRAFRRTRADRIWGAVGVLLVLWGLWLVFNWEPPIETQPSTGITWNESKVELDNTTFTIARTNPALTHTIPIDQANITGVTVSVTWMDDVGDEPTEWDALDFNLTGPEGSGLFLAMPGQVATNQEPNQVTMFMRVSPKPDVRSFPTNDLEEAKRQLGDRSNMTGTGEWTLEVVLSRVGDDFNDNNSRIVMGQAGDCPPQSTQGVPCTYDPGQSIEVAVSYDYYWHEFRTD